MPSEKALVNPTFLRWARDRRGYDIYEAARKIGVKEDKLVAAEEGHDHITINQLIKAAGIYKRPVAAFFLESIPEEIKLPDFRGKDAKYDGNLDVVIREFTELKEEGSNLYTQLNYKYNYEYVGSLRSSDNIEIIIKGVEQWIQLDRDKILHLKDNNALNYWKNIMEDLGILVFQFGGIDPDITRGFAFSQIPLPIIALNKNDTFYARIFTIVHEFVHILLDQTGICDTQKPSIRQINTERICNNVAAEYLLPSTIINERFEDRFDEIDHVLSVMTELSDNFKVSYSVIGIKFLKHELITNRQLNHIFDILEKRSEIKKNRDKEIRKQRGGGGNFYNIYESEKSKKFISILFESVYNDIISEFHAMEVLRITTNTYSHFQTRWERGKLS